MADRTQRLAIIVTAQDLASGKLGLVRKELGAMGPAGRISALGLGLGIGAARKGEEAFRHLGERLKSLAGPIGLLGLTGASLGVAGALEQGIEKATTMGFAVEKLTGLTGESAQSMSGLLAVFEKFGIDDQRTGQIVGFTEKALGKLTTTSGSAAKTGEKLAATQNNVTKAHEKLRVAELKLIELEAKGNASSSSLAAARYRVRDATAALTLAQAKLTDAEALGGAEGSKAEAIQRKYGVALVDSKGKALSFTTVLGNVADYYNSSAQASDKAYVASTVFGRGYAALIPILKLGSKGILDAEEAAKELGLTLTAQNADDLRKYRESVREASDAVSGLELQFGLLVVPDLTAALKTGTDWAREHRGDIEDFFKSALHGAEALASFVTGTVFPTLAFLGTAAKTGWDAIPAPLRDLLAKGLVADRTFHFLFGFSPAHMVLDLAKDGLEKGLGGLVGKLFQRGATPANPLFVADVTGGLGGVGGAAAAGEAAAGLGAAGVAAIVTSVVAPLAVAITALAVSGGIQDQAKSIGDSNAEYRKIASDADLANSIKGLRETIDAMGSGPLSNPFNQKGIAVEQLNALIAEQNRRASLAPDTHTEDVRITAAIRDGFLTADTHSEAVRIGQAQLAATKALAPKLDAIHLAFREARNDLKHAQSPAEIKAAVGKILESVMGKGLGGLAGAQNVIKELEAALRHTHDPETAKTLRAAIAAVETKLPNREYAARQLAKADQILHSSESAKQKIADLKVIENDLKNHKLPGEARSIRTRINSVKTSVDALPPKIAYGISAIVAGLQPGDTLSEGRGGERSNPSSTSSGGGGGSSSGSTSATTVNDRERADGGAGYPGKIYRVGERGEEWFRPRVVGDFIPHHAVSGLMSAGAARAVMIALQVTVNVAPKVTFGLRELQERTQAQVRLGKVTAS